MNPVFRIHTCVISFFCSFSRYVPHLPISIFISIKEFSTLLVLPSSVTSRLSPEKKTPRFLPFFLVVAGAIFPGKPFPPFCCSSHQQHGFPLLFITSAAWLPYLLQLVPCMERGPPHTSRVLLASRPQPLQL